MRKRRYLLFFIAFVLLSCNQSHREDVPSVEVAESEEVVEDEMQDEQLRDSTLKFELAQYIESHRKKLGAYADSIYYSVTIEESNKQLKLHFGTSTTVPIRTYPKSI